MILGGLGIIVMGVVEGRVWWRGRGRVDSRGVVRWWWRSMKELLLFSHFYKTFGCDICV